MHFGSSKIQKYSSHTQARWIKKVKIASYQNKETVAAEGKLNSEAICSITNKACWQSEEK